MSLSERIRAGSEAAPWVVEELKRMEAHLQTAADLLKDAAMALPAGNSLAAKADAHADTLRSIAQPTTPAITYSSLTFDEAMGYPDRGTEKQQSDYMAGVAARRAGKGKA